MNIDGSIMEGGGQVLRISIACAALLRKAITVNNIRAGRSQPGLKAQHLTGLELVSSICNGKLVGAAKNSTEVSLKPTVIRPGHYHADTKTAGSVMLLFQVSLPVALYAKGPVNMSLLGGTDADMAPPVDYTINVFKPMAAKFGVNFDIKTIRRGFFPSGQGEVLATVTPLLKPLKPVDLTTKGKVISVEGVCCISGLPDHLARRVEEAALKKLRAVPFLEGLVKPFRRDVNQTNNWNMKGLGLVLWATTDTGLRLGSSSLGKMHLGREKSTRPEDVGEEAADKLIKQLMHGACVDEEMQNQLIILMGLSEGSSRILCSELSLHTRTAIEIMHLTTQAQFTVTPEKENLVMVECKGIGLDPGTMG